MAGTIGIGRCSTSPVARACPPCQNQRSIIKRIASRAIEVAISSCVLTMPAFAGSVALTVPTAPSSPLHLEFAVAGLEVRPAADGVIPGTGHFHLFIDAEDYFPEGQPIQFDDSHKHYGKGQIAVDVALTPGKHKLTLQFANALHESYGAEYATTSVVTVP